MSFNKEQPRVAIIGAGIGGIATAIALKRQLNFDNFVIYERASDIGGTWRENTYPGCACDISGHWYSLSTDLNPNWSARLVGRAEIMAYWKGLVEKYGLRAHLALNTAVRGAVWDAAAQVYRLTVWDAAAGAERTATAEVVVSAAGGFVHPAWPADLPGRAAFAGPLFHSAAWRHDVVLEGRRVGVIGNGCSATQFIPEISSDPSVQVVNFCRTPSWFVPRQNTHYPAFVKWAFANIPFVLRAYRNFLMGRYDTSAIIFQKANTSIIAATRKRLTTYIKATAPREYVDKLIPSYAPGCKRIVLDSDYLASLGRPNVSMRWDGIDEIVPEGIKMKTGEVIPLDVIIFATGFDFGKIELNVKGVDGKTITEFYESLGGPAAYRGTALPGFPNYYTLLGPNSGTGHASVMFFEECQINYVLQMIKPVLERTAQSFEVARPAFDEHNAHLQRRLARTVWTDCASYYRVGSTGKNVSTYPGPATRFWWALRTPQWKHYKAVGAGAWVRGRRRAAAGRALLGMSVLLGVLAWSLRLWPTLLNGVL